MNKKILVAAIGAALSVGVAAAQAAEVKISGYANISVDMLEGNTGTGVDNESNLGVSSNSSNVVVSATEDLGNGLKGVFSLQQYFRMDNTGATVTDSAGNTSTTSRITDGNAYVGLQSEAAGMVIAGSHDTPAKLVGRSVDLFGNQIGDSRNLDVNNTRAQNVVAYLSPNWGGFTFALAHVTNLDNDISDETSTTANALMAKFESGPIMVSLGYDKADVDGTSDDPAWKVLGASFGPFGGVKINALYQQHDNFAGTADADTKGVGVAWKFGDNTLKGQYYMYTSDDTAAADNADMMAIGFDHAFSKAFTGYVAYATTDNEAAAARSVSAGGHGDNASTVVGKDPSGFSVGMVFKF